MTTLMQQVPLTYLETSTGRSAFFLQERSKEVLKLWSCAATGSPYRSPSESLGVIQVTKISLSVEQTALTQQNAPSSRSWSNQYDCCANLPTITHVAFALICQQISTNPNGASGRSYCLSPAKAGQNSARPRHI